MLADPAFARTTKTRRLSHQHGLACTQSLLLGIRATTW